MLVTKVSAEIRSISFHTGYIFSVQFSLKTERLWDALQDSIIVSLKISVPLDEPSLTDQNVVF